MLIGQRLYGRLIVLSLVNKAPTATSGDTFVSLTAHLLVAEASVKRNSHPALATVSVPYQCLNLLHVHEHIFLQTVP